MIKVMTISISDVMRCPLLSLSVAHYRDDGSCRCVEKEE